MRWCSDVYASLCPKSNLGQDLGHRTLRERSQDYEVTELLAMVPRRYEGRII